MLLLEEEPEGERRDLECGICCMPYDRCSRAPRRLGGAHGSWKPSRCGHVICSACVCRLAREGWWERVTCPYCRAVTSLRERGGGSFLVAARGRSGAGAGRRRLILPPIDVGLWQRVVRLEEEEERRGEEEEGARRGASSVAATEEEEEEEEKEGGERPGRLWRALKRLLKGRRGREEAHARDPRGRQGRSHSLPPRRRPAALMNPYGSELKDLAHMTCYII